MIQAARKTILIVDNDAEVAGMLAKAVVKMGYAVAAVVSTGEEAVEKVPLLWPDLVIMDVILDGALDGIQAGRYIEECYHTPSIYVTGYPDRVAELESHGKVPLVKPFTIENLKAAIGVVFYKFRKNNHPPYTLTDLARPLRDKTIIIVDDNRDFAEPLAEHLKGLGLHIPAIVSNAEAAFENCRKLNPDLVLMDVILEGDIDGIEAGRYLHDEHKIPVIYVTCHPQKAAILEETGQVPLQKPFPIEGLLSAIGAALYKSR